MDDYNHPLASRYPAWLEWNYIIRVSDFGEPGKGVDPHGLFRFAPIPLDPHDPALQASYDSWQLEFGPAGNGLSPRPDGYFPIPNGNIQVRRN
jgi:hypothetical protein